MRAREKEIEMKTNEERKRTDRNIQRGRYYDRPGERRKEEREQTSRVAKRIQITVRRKDILSPWQKLGSLRTGAAVARTASAATATKQLVRENMVKRWRS